jgi:hypothetical protein
VLALVAAVELAAVAVLLVAIRLVGRVRPWGGTV